jgi:hypothetical protein
MGMTEKPTMAITINIAAIAQKWGLRIALNNLNFSKVLVTY